MNHTAQIYLGYFFAIVIGSFLFFSQAQAYSKRADANATIITGIALSNFQSENPEAEYWFSIDNQTEWQNFLDDYLVNPVPSGNTYEFWCGNADGGPEVAINYTQARTTAMSYCTVIYIDSHVTYNTSQVLSLWQTLFPTTDFGTVAGPDTTPPVITLLGISPTNILVGASYSDAGATATDETDGNITGNIVTVNNVSTGVAGTYFVTYNVSDAAGNPAAQVTRTVNVQNVADANPVITLTGASTINLNVGDTYTESGATATDAEDGNITGSIIITGTVDTNVAGTYTLTYSVTDSGSNTVSTTRTIVVTAPVTSDKDQILYLVMLAYGFTGIMGFTTGLNTNWI